VADAEHVSRAMMTFGHEEKAARRIVILGGGNIGRYLAREIDQHPVVSAKVIEYDKAKAEQAASDLRHTVVLHGDALDPEILEEAKVSSAEAVVAVTNEDEVNILASLLAKRSGAQRAITLINKTSYSPLISSLGIDVVVSPRAITVSTILQHIRRGKIRAVYSLGDGFGEVIEAEALETSPLVGRSLREIDFPEGVILGALVRGGEVVIPRGDTVVKPKDRVILFATAAAVKKVERMFSVRLEFF
jgi:trk system potassium uptake protein TrkA